VALGATGDGAATSVVGVEAAAGLGLTNTGGVGAAGGAETIRGAVTRAAGLVERLVAGATTEETT
jgi:hypothetical protein